MFHNWNYTAGQKFGILTLISLSIKNYWVIKTRNFFAYYIHIRSTDQFKQVGVREKMTEITSLAVEVHRYAFAWPSHYNQWLSLLVLLQWVQVSFSKMIIHDCTERKKSSDDYIHQWIARQVCILRRGRVPCPVSVAWYTPVWQHHGQSSTATSRHRCDMTSVV